MICELPLASSDSLSQQEASYGPSPQLSVREMLRPLILDSCRLHSGKLLLTYLGVESFAKEAPNHLNDNVFKLSGGEVMWRRS